MSKRLNNPQDLSNHSSRKMIARLGKPVNDKCRKIFCGRQDKQKPRAERHKMINVRDYIGSPYIVSREDGACLHDEVSRAMRQEETIQLDFSGIERATTLFFFESLCRIAAGLGLDKYREIVKVHNMTDLVKVIYVRAMNHTFHAMYLKKCN